MQEGSTGPVTLLCGVILAVGVDVRGGGVVDELVGEDEPPVGGADVGVEGEFERASRRLHRPNGVRVQLAAVLSDGKNARQ